MTRTKKSGPRKGLSPVPVRPPEPEALARTIDEALALLDRVARGPGLPVAGPLAPLPSLLDRCEALLRGPGPAAASLRVIHGFAGIGRGLVRGLLAELPNLHQIRATEGAASSDLRHRVAAQGRWADWLTQRDGFARQGQALVVHLDHAPGAEAASPPQGVRACVLVEHPRLSYARAVQQGALGFAPPDLDSYAARYLDFLNRMAGLPVVTVRAPSGALAPLLFQLAAALDLTPPAALADEVDSGLVPLPSDPAPALTAGTRVDGPSYLRLCDRLDMDPDAPPLPTSALSVAVPGVALRRTLPPRTSGQSARLAHFLPRIARVTDSPEAPESLPDASALTGLVEACLNHPAGCDAGLDHHLPRLTPDGAGLLLIGAAAHFTALGQACTAVSLLTRAADLLPAQDRPLRLLLADLALRNLRADVALTALSADALSGPLALARPQASSLTAALATLGPDPGARGRT